MNKFLSIFISFCLLSCSGNQRKAEKIAAENINSEMPKDWTYTPVKFSKLSDALSSIKNEDRYKELKNKYDKTLYQYIYDSIMYRESYMADSMLYGKKHAESTKMKASSYEKNKLEEELFNLEQKYNPCHVGVGFVHVYLCKTTFGDSLFYSKFIFDDNLNITTKHKRAFLINSDSIQSIVERLQKDVDLSINDPFFE